MRKSRREREREKGRKVGEREKWRKVGEREREMFFFRFCELPLIGRIHNTNFFRNLAQN